MQTPLVSVIVPCYNSSKYLCDCLDSILSQDWKNLEILAVNDHSTDNTVEIIQNYAEKDSRVVLLNSVGHGLSCARNTGLDKVHGQWISFIDSDDLIPVDFISYLLGLCEENDAEISVIQPADFMDGTLPAPPPRVNSVRRFTWMEALKEAFIQGDIETPVWTRLYKREIWDGLRFPEGLVYEDLAVEYQIFSKAERVVVSTDCLYYYRQNKTGIMGSGLSQLKVDSAKTIIQMLDDTVKEEELQQSKKCRIVSLCFNILLQMEPGNKDRFFFLSRIRKYRKSVIFDKHSRRKTRIALLTSYFGLGFTRLIFDIIRK